MKRAGAQEGKSEFEEDIQLKRKDSRKYLETLVGENTARNVWYIPPSPYNPGKHIYLLATTHFKRESYRDATKLITALRPSSVVLELEEDDDALKNAKAGGFSPRLTGLLRRGYFAAFYQELIDLCRETLTGNKRTSRMDSEFGAAFEAAEKVEAKIVKADIPWYIRTERVFRNLMTMDAMKLLALSGRGGGADKANFEKLPSAWKYIEDMGDKSIICGGVEFHMVQAHERDLRFIDALKKAEGDVIVGVFGSEHVRGILDFWASEFDTDKLLTAPDVRDSIELWLTGEFERGRFVHHAKETLIVTLMIASKPLFH